jgi:chromosome segregation ATPase
MKKMLLSGVSLLIFLGFIGCANYGATVKINTLYNKVNDMQQSIVSLEKEVKRLNAKILEIKGPPTADLATLQERIEEVNDNYRVLATEISKIQEKVGITPMDTAPPQAK